MSILTSDLLSLKNYSESENPDCFQAIISLSGSDELKDDLARLNTYLFQAGLALSDVISKLHQEPNLDLFERFLISSIADGIFERKEFQNQCNALQ